MKEVTFNKEQEKAIHHIEGPLLVLAGAGSGKTYVVTYRIAHLLKCGISPNDILAVTFTNKAANEMRLRIQQLTNSNVLTCTFHSLGARILRESINLLSYSPNFSIYDTDDCLKLIKSCMETLNIKDEKGLSKKIKEKISSYKNDLLSYEEIPLPTNKDKAEYFTYKVYPEYQTKLQKYNALDFDDLIFLTVTLLKNNEQAREEHQNRWLFVLIDEYQDTNHAQYLLSKLLVNKHNNIFVVGDPDQSIYSWRGAKYQNILRFDKDFPNAKTIFLEHNYRSTNTLLEAANKLISHNPNRYEKNLWGTFGEGEKIGLYFANNEKQEAEFVVNTIIEKCKNVKIPLEDIVIFYRTNAQSRPFEDVFLRKQIPYIIFGGLSFYQRKEIKDILAYLRIILSDSDFIAFSRTINTPKRGIGKTTLQKLFTLTEQNNIPILSLCRDLINSPHIHNEIKLSSSQKKEIEQYLSIISQIKQMVNSKACLSDILNETIHLSNYLEYLQEDPDTCDDRKANLEELITKAIETQETRPSIDLLTFLEELSLLTKIEEKDKQRSVRLMTLHNGKGLEFSLVFLVGMEEDLLPHANAKNHQIEDIEEERRLCYVGITRAKKFLYLSASRYRHLWGSIQFMKPSRFIKEIPHEYIKILSYKYYFEPEVSFTKLNNTYDKITPGSKVVHKTFGQGIIQKIYTTSLGETYDIFFEEEAICRSLIAKYAKLQKIS